MAATQTSQLLLGWAGLGPGPQPPPDDVMLAPASTAHVWTFQTVPPPPTFPHAFLLILSFTAVRKKSQRPNVSASSLEECRQPGWEAVSGRGVLGCRDQEDPEMGYWKQPGLTCGLTQPPRHPPVLYLGDRLPSVCLRSRPGSNLTV